MKWKRSRTTFSQAHTVSVALHAILRRDWLENENANVLVLAIACNSFCIPLCLLFFFSCLVAVYWYWVREVVHHIDEVSQVFVKLKTLLLGFIGPASDRTVQTFKSICLWSGRFPNLNTCLPGKQIDQTKQLLELYWLTHTQLSNAGASNLKFALLKLMDVLQSSHNTLAKWLAHMAYEPGTSKTKMLICTLPGTHQTKRSFVRETRKLCKGWQLAPALVSS